MKHIEHLCLNCGKVFSPEEAECCPDRYIMICPVCGSAEWEELPETLADFVSELLYTPTE